MLACVSEGNALDGLNNQWRHGNIGRAMLNAFTVFEGEVLERLHSEGFGSVRAVHLNLYRNLDLEGTRLTELARRGNVTKQSMQDLVDRAEKLGFVERHQDSCDRRAKIVVFSPLGLVLLHALHRAILAAEQRVAAAIGVEGVILTARALRHYAEVAAAHPMGDNGVPGAQVSA